MRTTGPPAEDLHAQDPDSDSASPEPCELTFADEDKCDFARCLRVAPEFATSSRKSRPADLRRPLTARANLLVSPGLSN